MGLSARLDLQTALLRWRLSRWLLLLLRWLLLLSRWLLLLSRWLLLLLRWLLLQDLCCGDTAVAGSVVCVALVMVRETRFSRNFAAGNLNMSTVCCWRCMPAQFKREELRPSNMVCCGMVCVHVQLPHNQVKYRTHLLSRAPRRWYGYRFASLTSCVLRDCSLMFGSLGLWWLPCS